MRPFPTDVRSYRRALSNLVTSEENTAKWRFGSSKKRHFPSFSTTFLMTFSGFFRELFRRGANGREFGPEKRWCQSKLAPLVNQIKENERRADCLNSDLVPSRLTFTVQTSSIR